MSDLLRVYDPDECDEHGVPLDWERCNSCGGLMYDDEASTGCSRCGGYGSLKAAALASLLSRREAACGNVPQGWPPTYVIRCEDCGHPMSEGTWEHVGVEGWERAKDDCPLIPLHDPMTGSRMGPGFAVHYSSCDQGCKHHPTRVDAGMLDIEWVYSEADGSPLRWVEGPAFQASWRQVDVRTIGWPHDLRPEKLAVLCLRCWATKGMG